MAHWESKHSAKKPWSLGNAAELGQLLAVRCNLCRRTVHFLASDLLEFFDDETPALRVAFPCSRCATQQFMRVNLRLPDPGDWGNLLVRRPAEVVRIQKWRTVRLGDNARPAPPATVEEQMKREAEEFDAQAARAYEPPGKT